MYYVFDLRFVLYFSLQTRNLPYMVNEVSEYNFIVLSKIIFICKYFCEYNLSKIPPPPNLLMWSDLIFLSLCSRWIKRITHSEVTSVTMCP